MNPETPAAVPAPAPSTDQAAPTSYKSNPFELIKPAFEAFKLCWLNVLLALLVMIGSFIALFAVFAIGSLANNSIVNAILFLIATPALVYIFNFFAWSITKAVLGAVRGQKMPFKETFPTKWNDPFKLFWTQIVTGFLIILGFLLLIVPGIFAMAFWSFAPVVNVDTGEWGWAALKKSREIMRGRTMDVLGALFVISIFGVVSLIGPLGDLAFFVFAILTLPLIYVRYNSLISLKQQPEWQSVPTSKWNYLALIFGLLLGSVQTNSDIKDFQKNLEQVELNNKAY